VAAENYNFERLVIEQHWVAYDQTLQGTVFPTIWDLDLHRVLQPAILPSSSIAFRSFAWGIRYQLQVQVIDLISFKNPP
jgi:hypothetical protein